MNIVSKICFSKQCYSQIKIFSEKREIIQALYAWLSIQRKIRIEIGSKRAFLLWERPLSNKHVKLESLQIFSTYI